MRPAIVYECEGYKYIVLNVFNCNEYGQKRVYHILTDNQKWCGKVIDKIMNDGSINRGLWQTIYDRTKSIFDYLKPFHSIEYIDDAEYANRYPGIKDTYPSMDLSGYYEYIYERKNDD